MKEIQGGYNMGAKINGEDIYQKYGAILKKGAYKELMSSPKTKAVIENKSRLKDGVDVTVLTFGSRRRLEDREVNLSFVFKSASYQETISNYKQFNNTISRDLIKFAIEALDKTFRLLFVEQTSLEIYANDNIIIAGYKFREPNPSDREND